MPALLPCIWHSRLQRCALLNPLALQRAIVLTALLQRWSIQMNLGYTMTPTSQSWLPSFVGNLEDGWISPAWCIVSGWLSTWACSALKGHRSSMCFVVLHEGWREMQICGDHWYKGKAGIRFCIGVHLRRRGKIKNNSVHCGALSNVKNSPEINIFLSGEEKGMRRTVEQWLQSGDDDTT